MLYQAVLGINFLFWDVLDCRTTISAWCFTSTRSVIKVLRKVRVMALSVVSISKLTELVLCLYTSNNPFTIRFFPHPLLWLITIYYLSVESSLYLKFEVWKFLYWSFFFLYCLWPILEYKVQWPTWNHDQVFFRLCRLNNFIL